jgi:hypothetical protein
LITDKHVTVNCIGFICSVGSSLAFFNSIDGGFSAASGSFCRAARVEECPPNQADTSERQDHAREGCPKHSFCPESHILLGFQIAYLEALLPLALLGVFTGYLITYRGLDRIERGDKALSIGLLLAGAALALFCAGFLPGFGYWLTFEGGAQSLLR